MVSLTHAVVTAPKDGLRKTACGRWMEEKELLSAARLSKPRCAKCSQAITALSTRYQKVVEEMDALKTFGWLDERSDYDS